MTTTDATRSNETTEHTAEAVPVRTVFRALGRIALSAELEAVHPIDQVAPQ